jgi:hypothetical protein
VRQERERAVPGAIFRESALEAHRRRAQRDLVPRVVSTPIILCSWPLLRTLLAPSYDGSRVAGRVQIGSQRLAALIPGLGRLFGGARE